MESSVHHLPERRWRMPRRESSSDDRPFSRRKEQPICLPPFFLAEGFFFDIPLFSHSSPSYQHITRSSTLPSSPPPTVVTRLRYPATKSCCLSTDNHRVVLLPVLHEASAILPKALGSLFASISRKVRTCFLFDTSSISISSLLFFFLLSSSARCLLRSSLPRPAR